MTDPQRLDSSDADVAAAAATEPKPPATPRWVKNTGVVLALIFLAVVAKVVFGGGVSHGPGMHSGLGTGALRTPPSAAVLGLRGL